MLLHTEGIQMRKEHEIIFNIPLATREMKLKQEWGITTWLLECFKKLLTSANKGENVNKLDHFTFSIINTMLLNMLNGPVILENSMTLFYNAKHVITTCPNNSTLTIYSREIEIHVYEKTLYRDIYTSFILNSHKL